MKILFTLLAVMSIVLTSCDVQSGITKKAVEKYQPTPTPSISPTPTEIPIDPADVVVVDTSLQGEAILINGPNAKKTVTCTKFNRVMVNDSDNVVTIKGACRQITINGKRNEVTADAAMEFVINGTENNIRYSRFVNGKRPAVTQNGPVNVVEKISPNAAK